MSSARNFENKVVLVTGSNSGIGEATVILFAKLGAQVVVTGRDAKRVAEVAKKVEEVSPNNLKVNKIYSLNSIIVSTLLLVQQQNRQNPRTAFFYIQVLKISCLKFC